MLSEKEKLVDVVKSVLAEMNDYDLEDEASRKAFFSKEFYFGFGTHIVAVPIDADVWEIMNTALNEVLKILKGEY